MTEREALYAAVRANPEDDLPRLVLADWMDENGEGERAELIRRELSHDYGPAHDTGETLIGRVGRCLRAIPGDLFGLSDVPELGPESSHTMGGFLSSVSLPFSSWVQHADRILAESVGLTVRLTDRPGQLIRIPGEWRYQCPHIGTVSVTDEMIEEHGADYGYELLFRHKWADVATWELPPLGRIDPANNPAMFSADVGEWSGTVVTFDGTPRRPLAPPVPHRPP